MTDETQSSLRADSIWTRRTLAAGGTLAALVIITDLLFWPHEPGISMAMFCGALLAGVLALHPTRLRNGRTLALVLLAVIAALPLVESDNILWWPMTLGAVGLVAMSAAGLLPRFEDWFGAVTRFAILAPVRLIGDGVQLLGEAGQQQLGGRLIRLALVWLIPIGVAAVFAFLLVAANPVLELGLHAIRLDVLLQLLDPARVLVWGIVAAIAWPLLAPKLLNWAPLPQMQGPVLPKAESLVFGTSAIRNSLVVFNAMFAVQTVMDLAFLWGGIRLPEGMSHADYAHRGAYPLIVTAVLAGAFVLAAMRRDGPARQSPLIRALVYLWIGQNIWLVISSMLRLWVYVEAYSLTELRILAGLWMVVVAVGLALIIARIVFDRSNKWLVMANSVSLALALYVVAWLDFPAVISGFNVAHASEVSGESGVSLDLYYMEQLGPGVIPALDRYILAARDASADSVKAASLLRDTLADGVLDVRDWQSWTWRAARLRQYVLKQPFAPDPQHAR